MFWRQWFSESRYLSMLNLLCEYLNRTKWWPIREVKYWNWKYHYTEKLNWDVFYSCSFKSPMDMYDEIMRIAFNF